MVVASSLLTLSFSPISLCCYWAVTGGALPSWALSQLLEMLFLLRLVLADWTCPCQAACQQGHVAWQLLHAGNSFSAVFLVTAPCAGQEMSVMGLPAWALLNSPHSCTHAPQREREIQGKREMTRGRVTNHTEEGVKQIGTSRGCVLAADGLCAGCSLVLVWICMTMRSISLSGTRLEESQWDQREIILLQWPAGSFFVGIIVA